MADSSKNPRIVVGHRPAEVCKKLADFIVDDMAKKSGPYHVAWSGGSTPKVLFKLLAEEYLDRIDWSRLHSYWGDERMVPHDHEESNYRMCRALLLDQVPVTEDQIHPVHTELMPEIAASDYSETLLENLPTNDAGLPVFDLNILGMGDDGHTASIFPHQMELLTDKRVCAVATHPDSGQKRVTITGPVINASAKVIFLVTGARKAEKVGEILGGSAKAETYPAAHVQPENGGLYWFLDEGAYSNR
ncbi:MAG: 6-phosphogluconolactonase [Bacteroidota bacterium]